MIVTHPSLKSATRLFLSPDILSQAFWMSAKAPPLAEDIRPITSEMMLLIGSIAKVSSEGPGTDIL